MGGQPGSFAMSCKKSAEVGGLRPPYRGDLRNGSPQPQQVRRPQKAAACTHGRVVPHELARVGTLSPCMTSDRAHPLEDGPALGFASTDISSSGSYSSRAEAGENPTVLSPDGLVLVSTRCAPRSCTTQQPQQPHHLPDDIVIKVLAAAGSALTPAHTTLSKGTQLSAWPAAEVVQLLSYAVNSKRAPLTLPPIRGSPALVRAAALGRSDVVQKLLESSQADLWHIRAALEFAVVRGNLSVCEVLLPASGLQLSQGRDGEAPEQLHAARIRLMVAAARSGRHELYQWVKDQLLQPFSPQAVLEGLFQDYQCNGAACSVVLHAHPNLRYSYPALLAARRGCWADCSQLLHRFQQQPPEQHTPQDLQHIADILPVAAPYGSSDVCRQLLSLPIGPAPAARAQALRKAVERSDYRWRWYKQDALGSVTVLLSDPHYQYPKGLLQDLAATTANPSLTRVLYQAASDQGVGCRMVWLKVKRSLKSYWSPEAFDLSVYRGNEYFAVAMFVLVYYVVANNFLTECAGNGGDWARFGCWKCSMVLVPLVVVVGILTPGLVHHCCCRRASPWDYR